MIALFFSLLLPARAGDAIEAYREAIERAPVSTEVDEKGTFRDLNFGTTCSRVQGFVPAKTVGDMQSYRRPSDKLAVGAADLTNIAYLCMKDRLRVVLLLADEEAFLNLTVALAGTYGKTSIKEKNFYYWRGSKRAAWIMLHGEEEQTVMVSIGDLPWGDPLGLIRSLMRQQKNAGASDL